MKTTIAMLALIAMVFTSCTKERLLTEPGNLVPKTVDQDPGLPAITINGARLHAEAFGPANGTLVIVLHGGPGEDYRPLLNCKDLVDHGYRVVFYDQRGSGLSQRFPESSYTSLGLSTLDLMYNELTGVIAHYRTSPNQKVMLLGHSWGAILAAGYAGRYPNAVQGLIVCEPGGLKWDDIVEFVSESRKFNLWGEMLNDVTYMDQFITGKEDQHEILDYKMVMMSGKNDITGDDNSEPGSFWRSGAVINLALFKVGNKHNIDFSTGLQQFDVPVLFIYSEKNKAYPDSWAQKISGAFKSKTLHKVNGVGHLGIIKDSHAWNNSTRPRILAYLDSL